MNEEEIRVILRLVLVAGYLIIAIVFAGKKGD
jgi:hypothetical protein